MPKAKPEKAKVRNFKGEVVSVDVSTSELTVEGAFVGRHKDSETHTFDVAQGVQVFVELADGSEAILLDGLAAIEVGAAVMLKSYRDETSGEPTVVQITLRLAEPEGEEL